MTVDSERPISSVVFFFTTKTLNKHVFNQLFLSTVFHKLGENGDNLTRASSPLLPSHIVISSLSGLLFEVTFVLLVVICMFRNPWFIFLIGIFGAGSKFLQWVRCRQKGPNCQKNVFLFNYPRAWRFPRKQCFFFSAAGVQVPPFMGTLRRIVKRNIYVECWHFPQLLCS